jgi:hypothetical protein
MRWSVLVVVAAGGCSTLTLRVGGVLVGDRPAVEASIAMGMSVGGTRSLQITHEHGVEAGEQTSYVGALDADYVFGSDDGSPFARIGPRVRFTDTSTAVEVRSTVFTGLGDDAKTHSGGVGFELAGGVDLAQQKPVFEAAIVMHGRWPID